MTKNDWDVIVIGGGGAGLCAAVAAREAGQEVLLLSKGPIGRGCATAYSGGLFSVAVEGMTVEEHRKRSLECGRDLNQDFHFGPGTVKAYTRAAPNTTSFRAEPCT